MALTVQELINLLSKIEDKSKEVVEDYYGNNVIGIEEKDGVIWIITETN